MVGESGRCQSVGEDAVEGQQARKRERERPDRREGQKVPERSGIVEHGGPIIVIIYHFITGYYRPLRPRLGETSWEWPIRAIGRTRVGQSAVINLAVFG